MGSRGGRCQLAKTATLALGIVGGGLPRAGVLEEGLSGPRIAPVETSTVTADLAQTRTAAAGARQATAAPSVSPHRMSAELVRDGEVIQSGDFVSGQTRGAKNWQGQLRVHTERMAVRSAEAVAEEGDLLRMNGQLDPCRVGCQPAVRNFVDTTGASAEYNASLTGRAFRWAAQRFGELKGTVLQEVFEQGGELAGRWRYWRTEAGRWRRAALPSQEAEHATGTSGK